MEEMMVAMSSRGDDPRFSNTGVNTINELRKKLDKKGMDVDGLKEARIEQKAEDWMREQGKGV